MSLFDASRTLRAYSVLHNLYNICVVQYTFFEYGYENACDYVVQVLSTVCFIEIRASRTVEYVLALLCMVT